jgi:hypothetical protein
VDRRLLCRQKVIPPQAPVYRNALVVVGDLQPLQAPHELAIALAFGIVQLHRKWDTRGELEDCLVARRLLVLLLIASLLSPGCGTTSHEVVDKVDGGPLWEGRPSQAYPVQDWFNEHPVAKAAGVVGLVALGVVAVGILYLGAKAIVPAAMH